MKEAEECELQSGICGKDICIPEKRQMRRPPEDHLRVRCFPLPGARSSRFGEEGGRSRRIGRERSMLARAPRNTKTQETLKKRHVQFTSGCRTPGPAGNTGKAVQAGLERRYRLQAEKSKNQKKSTKN